MTLVLKSNNVANQSISDQHGLIAAKDWTAMFDFENETYLTQNSGVKSNIDILNYLETVNKNPVVYEKSGEYVTLVDNSLRLSLNKKKDAFGLCEESPATNYYFPSHAPISKKIPLVQGARIGPYLVKMEGSGRVSFSSSSLKDGSSSFATQENPAVFFTENPDAIPELNIEIIGEVTSLSITTGSYDYRSDNITLRTQQSKWWFDTTVTKMKAAKVAELLANKPNFSIVFQCVDNEYLNLPQTLSTYKPLLELINSNNHISIMKRKLLGSTEELAIRLFNGAESILTVAGVNRVSTIAISCGAEGFRIAVDGKVTNPSGLMQNFRVGEMLIGSSTQWLAAFVAKAEGVFTKLAIYDRQLTSQELSKVTLSF